MLQTRWVAKYAANFSRESVYPDETGYPSGGNGEMSSNSGIRSRDKKDGFDREAWGNSELQLSDPRAAPTRITHACVHACNGTPTGHLKFKCPASRRTLRITVMLFSKSVDGAHISDGPRHENPVNNVRVKI